MARECVVYGKGDKERKAYFDVKTKIHLMNYIESRTDNNSALFVSLNKPHSRLTESGVELHLREMHNHCKCIAFVIYVWYSVKKGIGGSANG